jgi:hypothetical protein
MKHVLVVLTALALVCGTALIAQAPHHTGKKIRDEITLSQPVMVGSTMLKAGQYEIICDGATMSFTLISTGEKALTVQCHGKELATKAASTEIYIDPGPKGIGVVSKILLKGSTIEHTFEG